MPGKHRCLVLATFLPRMYSSQCTFTFFLYEVKILAHQSCVGVCTVCVLFSVKNSTNTSRSALHNCAYKNSIWSQHTLTMHCIWLRCVYSAFCLIHSALYSPFHRCRRFQCLGVFWKPYLLLQLWLFCCEWPHINSYGCFQPWRAIWDSVKSGYILAKFSEVTYARGGANRYVTVI